MDDMWKHFGLERDPFVWAECFESADVREVKRRVKAAVADRAWIAIIGGPGTGKTFALDHARTAVDCHWVPVLAGSRKWVKSGAIDEAIMLELAQESAVRSREARRRQMRRVLGEASRQKPILLYLDEATDILPSTFTEVKFLRDSLRFGSDPRNPKRQDPRPLFGVIMVGWHSLADIIRRSAELRPRIHIVMMKGLAKSEVHEYVEQLGLARACPKKVIELITDQCRYPLAINERLSLGLERAWLRGDKTLLVEDVTIDETDLFILAQRYGIRAVDLVKRTGLSPATVSQAMNGAAIGQRSKDTLKAELETMIAEKSSQKNVG